MFLCSSTWLSLVSSVSLLRKRNFTLFLSCHCTRLSMFIEVEKDFKGLERSFGIRRVSYKMFQAEKKGA